MTNWFLANRRRVSPAGRRLSSTMRPSATTRTRVWPRVETARSRRWDGGGLAGVGGVTPKAFPVEFAEPEGGVAVCGVGVVAFGAADGAAELNGGCPCEVAALPAGA